MARPSACREGNPEQGHVGGLAHESLGTTAIMVQGDPGSNYLLLQQDDRNGIIHIYGAYP